MNILLYSSRYGICAANVSTDSVKYSVWSAFEQSADSNL